MKTIKYIVFVLAVILSTNLSHAESTLHDIAAMYSAGTLTVDGAVGTTDFVTYTCNGNASFASYNGNIYILLQTNNSAYVATTAINDLDSIRVSGTDMTKVRVYTAATQAGPWTQLTVGENTTPARGYKVPTTGNYCIKIGRNSGDSYITKIEYITKPCNCLRVVSE